MANNNKYIPTLRFPEFQNDGEWKRCKLSDIAIRKGKKNTTGIELPVYTNSATSGVINQEEYFDREIVTKDNLVNYGIIESNDFVYNPRVSVTAPVGPISRNKLSCGIMSPLYLIFGFNSGDINFFEHYFKGNSWHNYLRAKANYGARFDRINIGTKEFMDMPIPYPSLAEQKKIADCLSSLDKYIDATKRKLELLKEHKKGLMQRLFPTKGKTTPELRFPEFQNEGEWIYEHGDILYESIVNKKHKSDLPILAITQENGAIPRDEINYRVVVEDKSIEGYKVVEVGDFIISLRSFQGGIEYSRYKGLCSPAYIVLRKIHSKICDDFYRHYFKSFQYIQELNRNLEGIRDGKMISYKQFADIKLPYPSYEEQCKIAKVLSSIDDVIQTHIDKILALELHKNGLMQQLFPKL